MEKDDDDDDDDDAHYNVHNGTEFRCVCKTAESDFWSRHVCLSVRNKPVTAGRIFIEFDMSTFRISVEKIKVSLKSDKNYGYFT